MSELNHECGIAAIYHLPNPRPAPIERLPGHDQVSRLMPRILLDLRQMHDVAAGLRRHAERGRTLFLSIHQIADAARICDRFVLLSNGRVRGEGTVAELAEQAAGRRTHAGLEWGPGASLEEVFLALT